MKAKTNYTLTELIEECNLRAPIPPEVAEWEQEAPVGQEVSEIPTEQSA